MPRVWKHFLKNLAWPVGIVFYISVVSVIATYADKLFTGGSVFVAVLFICVPVLTYLVREMWRDAKEKVEHENREIMRQIKGNYS